MSSRDASPNPSAPPVSPGAGPSSPAVIINTGTSKNSVLFQRGTEPESTPSPPPLPPPVDSNPSFLDESGLGPYLEPPAEFSENPSSKVCQNGAFVSPDEHIHRGREPSLPVSIDNDQMVLLPNSNGNNNNSNGVCLVRVRRIARGGTKSGLNAQVPPQNSASCNPSQTSTLSHSENPDVQYSSMESGFDADTEQDSSVWYLSPDSSPKHHKHLGPTVLPPPQTRTNYRTGSQFRTSSVSDDYDHLPSYKSKMASVSPPGHQSTHGHHQPSRSFDACEILSTKPRPQHKAVFGAPAAPCQSAQMPVYAQPSRKRTDPSQHPQRTSAQRSGHTRSFSQPEELHKMVAQQGGVAGGDPLRHHRGAAVTQKHPHPVFTSSYGSRLERERASRHPHRPEHVVSDEALQRVNMLHMGGSAPGKPFGGHGGERARHKSLPAEKLRTHHHQQETHYMSDESQTSGGTPTTPSLPQKVRMQAMTYAQPQTEALSV